MADGEELGQRIAALSARVDDSIAKARGGKPGRDGDGDGILNEGGNVSHALRHAISGHNPLRHIGGKFQPGPTVPAAEALEALLSRPEPPTASELIDYDMSFEKGWVEWSKRQKATTATEAFGKALRAAMEEPPKPETAIERIGKGLKGFWQSWMHPRAPKGSPDGGKFSGNGGGSGAAPKPKVSWQHDLPGEDWAPTHPKFDGPKSGAKWTGKLDTGPRKEHPLPKGAVKHPAVDNHGDEVWVKYPSKPSPSVVWDDPEATATFTPGSLAPEVIQGIPTKLAYKPPQTAAEWTAVPGQNPEVEAIWPELTAPKGQHVGAGVIVQEPDGRVWIVSPTNGFGGYRQTFPKGTYEEDVPSLQANAIKEAFEESGLQVEITGVLGDFQRTTSVARMYLAKRVGGSPAHMGWESQAVRLAPVSTLRTWLNRGNIDHPIVDALEDITGEWTAKGFDEAKHDRWPKGSPLGGQFKATGEGGFTSPPKIGWKKDGSGPGANATYYNQMKAAYDAIQKGDTGPAMALYKKNFAVMDSFNPNVKTNSHTKWKAQVGQYAFDLLAVQQDKGMAANSAKVVEGKLGALSIKGWKLEKESGLGGTAPKGLYTDETGQKWLVKGNLQGKDDARARNEVLASKLMQAAGIPAPEYKLVDLGDKYGGGLGVATKWEDGLKKVTTAGQKLGAKSQFAVHAWLGNWDVVGVGGDNLLVRANGEVVNIDPGGALLYRAQGVPKKPLEWTTSAKDWETMRDPAKNADAAAMFGTMDASMLNASAEKLEGVTDEKIDALVDAYWVDTDTKTKSALASDLKGRRDMILMKAGVKGPGMSEPGAAPVKTPRAPSAKTGDFAAIPPKLTPGSKAALAVETMQTKEAVMGKPDKAMLPMLSMASNGWVTNAMHSTGQTQWDALQAATYFAQLQVFHDSQNAALMAETPKVMGEYVYGSQSDWVEAKAKYDGKGVGTMAAGVSVASTPSASGVSMADMNPKITDMKSVQTYKEIVFSVADAGGQPLPPDIGGKQQGDIATFAMWDKNWSTMGGPETATKQAMAAGTFYSGLTSDPKFAALGVYAQALALKHGMTVPAYDAWMKGDAPTPIADAMNGKTIVEVPFEPSPAKTTVSADPDTVKPAMPDFAAAKLDASNTNAASHNAKVDLIEKLALAKDFKGIFGLGFGTNTYGKKQAALANNALAALGSPGKVEAGQKPGTHMVFDGETPATQPAKPKPLDPKKVKITKADLPTKPVFTASKKAWKNEQNNALVDQVEAKALEADLPGLKALQYEVITDNEEGTKTGKLKPFAEHPSSKIQQYWQDSVNFVDDKLNPPKPLDPAKVINAASLAKIAEKFPAVPLMTTVDKLPSNQRMGFWAVLGQVKSDREALLPSMPEKALDTPSFKAKVKEAYSKATSLSKSFMSSVQGSGGINSAYNKGAASYNGINLIEANKAMHADAMELPEGAKVYKWIQMPQNMRTALQNAPVGTVLQNPGSACNSMSPSATKGFGPEVRIVYRAAKGAKMLPSYGSGSHSHEQELTSLPGARMVLLGAKQVSDDFGTRFEIEVTLLPPHKNSLITKL